MVLNHTEMNSNAKFQPPTSTLPAFLARVPRPLASRAFAQKQMEASISQNILEGTKMQSPQKPTVIDLTKDSDEEGASTMPAFLSLVPRPLASRAFARQQEATALSYYAPKPALRIVQDQPTKIVTDPTSCGFGRAFGQKPREESITEPIVNDCIDTPKETKPRVTEVGYAMMPVVSVKKSSRGCAVVILRDEAVVERCALQRVAVIDGVCVEMKRHFKRSRVAQDGEEKPLGIFCAWGMKVERKVPISEEGIADFFNSLAGTTCPEGLVATPPFEESHVLFHLKSGNFATPSYNIEQIDADQDKVLSSWACPRNLIESSWAAKDRLDALWNRPPPPMARSLITRVARSQLFPHSGEGGQDHENRAGDKLAQISNMVGLLDNISRGSAFLDLCGGPGAWSQHLLGKHDLALQGFGFTLKAESGGSDDWKAQAKDEWYQDLIEHPNWTALWGLDGSGDLLKIGNLEHCVKGLAGQKVLLVVADGGFSDEAIPANLLELYFYRLLLAELLTAATCLRHGGKFVCKLYSTFSDSTSALLYLATQLFDSVSIVKPMSSKATGPERYLVGTGFRDDAQTSTIQEALSQSHALAAGHSPLTVPLLTPVVPVQSLQQDLIFSVDYKHMVTALCERQTKALNAVVDRADFLEEVAMDCAVCTDPWSKPAPTHYMRSDKYDQENVAPADATKYGTVPMTVPTPARATGGWKQWQ